MPPPGTLGGDDRLHGFRLGEPILWRAFGGRAVTMLVMVGGFDISRASLSRPAGERGRSVRLPPEEPSDARQRPLRSATFARPSSGHSAGPLPPDGVAEWYDPVGSMKPDMATIDTDAPKPLYKVSQHLLAQVPRRAAS